MGSLLHALTRPVKLRVAVAEAESSAAGEATTSLAWGAHGLHVRLEDTAEGVVSMGMEGRINSAICALNPWLSNLVRARPLSKPTPDSSFRRRVFCPLSRSTVSGWAGLGHGDEKVANRNVRVNTARQKMGLERWTNPTSYA
jgi:hypothetical protein